MSFKVVRFGVFMVVTTSSANFSDVNAVCITSENNIWQDSLNYKNLPVNTHYKFLNLYEYILPSCKCNGLKGFVTSVFIHDKIV
jgi:hypothetical protein